MWTYIKEYFLFTEPWRRLLLKISKRLPEPYRERLLYALYPPDLIVYFPDDVEGD